MSENVVMVGKDNDFIGKFIRGDYNKQYSEKLEKY
jgi:hypothetical protein